MDQFTWCNNSLEEDAEAKVINAGRYPMRLLCLYYKITIEPTHSYYPSGAQTAHLCVLSQSRCREYYSLHTLATHPTTLNTETGQVINKI
jgi:hypothetical protein